MRFFRITQFTIKNKTMNGDSQKRIAAMMVSHPPCSSTANIEPFYRNGQGRAAVCLNISIAIIELLRPQIVVFPLLVLPLERTVRKSFTHPQVRGIFKLAANFPLKRDGSGDNHEAEEEQRC